MAAIVAVPIFFCVLCKKKQGCQLLTPANNNMHTTLTGMSIVNIPFCLWMQTNVSDAVRVTGTVTFVVYVTVHIITAQATAPVTAQVTVRVLMHMIPFVCPVK
jgi:hypothetical protein